MKTTVVVGNLKPASRTLDAARRLAEGLTARPADNVIDRVELGPALRVSGAESVARVVRTVQEPTVVVFASPTFTESDTGLLTLFLDQFLSAKPGAAPLTFHGSKFRQPHRSTSPAALDESRSRGYV